MLSGHQFDSTAPGNIIEKDTGFLSGKFFCPLCQPGVCVPEDKEITALSLFKLFFDDDSVSRIVQSSSLKGQWILWEIVPVRFSQTVNFFKAAVANYDGFGINSSQLQP